MTKNNSVEDGSVKRDEDETVVPKLQLEVTSLDQVRDAKGMPSSVTTTTTTTCEGSNFCVDLKATDNQEHNVTRLDANEHCSSAIDVNLEEEKDHEGEALDIQSSSQYNMPNSEHVEPLDEPLPEFGPDLTKTQRCKSRDDSVEADQCRPSTDLSSPRWNLLYSSRDLLKLKDFRSEVRALMDVEQFVHQSELMLDLVEVSVEEIVTAMLKKAVPNEKVLASAREAIFVSGSSMMVAHTIQGVIYQSFDQNNAGSLSYDQSWLCAVCNLSQINQRLMIISRFKQPINFGENAHEIRLLMLILTPSKEKGTKNAIETGRTFATMFTDFNFRQKLLSARTEVQFKSLMIVKAQRLSQSKSLKNRHKYKLDPAVHLSIKSLSLNRGSLSDGKDLADQQQQQQEQQQQNKFNSSGALSSKLVPENRGDEDTNNNNYNNADQIIFSKNPRASKLFDLIASADSTSATQQKVEMSQLESKLESSAPSIEPLHNKSAASSLTNIFRHIEFGKGLFNDFLNRATCYPSDFSDAFIGPPKTIQKTIATIWFLYFGILLPTIAFSALNTTQTGGHMGDLRKAIIGQAIGGLTFALFGGQPLVIIMTTAPLCLYTKVIHKMCADYGFDFLAMYAAVGLWNCLFLLIYSLFGFSKLMKWCTRSTEEVFALFIVIAFITDAGKDLMKNFNKYYYSSACQSISNQSITNTSTTTEYSTNHNRTVSFLTNSTSSLLDSIDESQSICRREASLLFLLLMLGTLWLATTLYKFNKTPFLEAGKRDLLADYALPTAVIIMSFIGSFVFDEIYVEKFPPLQELHFERANLKLLPTSGILTAAGLGFTLSLLFFMDQNISAAMVNAPQNKLKKSGAYHLDLLVVGILNAFLTIFGLPMMHGVLPHSPLHVRSLADIEERVEEGHVTEVIENVRENRVTGMVSHFLILATLLLIPHPIAYIPRAVLNGLFLYMAVTSLEGLQIFERILLLFTEQSKYPPNHYIRRCPQRKIHNFTILQLLQLAVMCLFGFSPINVVEMFFPVIILLMIPFRHSIVPKYIGEKYLIALDGKH